MPQFAKLANFPRISRRTQQLRARRDGAKSITAIYGHAVLHGNASFELDPPDAIEIARRRDALLAGGYPYLVAEQNGVVVGYSYALA